MTAVFTLPRISFEGLNVGTKRSGKKTDSPVLGFRAFLGNRCLTPNVPNPLSSTFLFSSGATYIKHKFELLDIFR